MRLVLLTAIAVFCLAASTARAEDVTGKFGIGADTTLSGSQGAQLRCGLMPRLDLQVLLRFEHLSGENDATASTLDFAVLGHYAMIEWTGLAFDVFGGINVQHAAFDDGGEVDDSATDIGLEIGFGPNWWVTPNLALNLGIGLSILLDSDDPDDDDFDEDDFDGNRISFFGDAELVGFAGFTYWFR